MAAKTTRTPNATKLQTLEERQAEADNRITRVEGQIKSLVGTVEKLAGTVSESHQESQENFRGVYGKLDGLRDLFSASRATNWVPLISALVAGAGFVSLMVSPIRSRAHNNESSIFEMNKTMRENYRHFGAMEGRIKRNSDDLEFQRDRVFELGEKVSRIEGASP